MTSIAIPSAVQAREWITPQEQLDRLHKYYAQPIADKISASEIFGRLKDIPGITSIIAEYAVEGLSPDLTDWHTALKLRGALPDKIPPLPWNMPQIMEGKCPIWGNELKPDGIYYTNGDKWSLCLKTPETVNALDASVKAYGESVLNAQRERLYYDNRHPFQLNYFWGLAYQEHGHKRSNDESYWILHTNTVIPESRNKSYQEQVQLVAKLSAEAHVDCEIPSFSETATAYFNRKITRKESLFPGHMSGEVLTFTRVKETSQNRHLIVGASGPYGVAVYGNDDSDYMSIGVAVVQRV